MKKTVDIYSLAELQALLEDIGQPRFRFQQLLSWLYEKGITSYDQATNLPSSLRDYLSENVPLYFPEITDKAISADGTRKYLLRLKDGNLIETVGIPVYDQSRNAEPGRLTVCFSTQVGCPMECSFCATGQEGFTRNLTSGEMAQQVLVVAQDFGHRVSNVVAMGQGEPFLNYNNTLNALRIINHPHALGIGARHITVSTCGIEKEISRFGAEPEQFVLAVSLHSAIQETRDRLMPRCANTPLTNLKIALLEYQAESGRRITFEHLLIKGINNESRDLEALIDYCRGLHAHVNLLPMNEVSGSSFSHAVAQDLNKWVKHLENAGISASIRDSRGSDIQGACGQLKNSSASTR